MSDYPHTPGPWVFDGSEVRTPKGQLRTTGITLMCGSGDMTEEKANARLIAAAPEMLAALIAERNWKTDIERARAADMRHAAIAKATGKENA